MPYDALSGRTPAWWLPGKKPGRIHAVELDPQGKLREGLLSCILFQTGPWQRDFAQPQRTFTKGGSGTVTYADSPFGGTLTTASNTYLSVSLPVQTPGAWTDSCLVRFNATNPFDACFFATDGANNQFFSISGPSAPAPGSLAFNGTNIAVGAFRAINYTGWHRITCTASAGGAGSTGIFYLDGKLVGTGTLFAGVSQFAALMGDAGRSNIFTNFPIADHFLWGYALSAAQVMQHYISPYRTVLRPKFSELGRVGPMVTRRPSLLTTGVGP